MSFYTLFHLRANPHALKVGTQAPDLALVAPDGKKMMLSEINEPVMLVFYNTKTFLSGGMYTQFYLNRMPFMKGMDESGRAKLVILTDTKQDINIIRKEFGQSRYKILENRVYLSNIKHAEDVYGLSVWPHFFLIDKKHTIIYQAKVPSMELVDDILDRS